MPEGDTVHRTARGQHAALAGSVLTGTDFRVPRFATLDLTGETVDEVVAFGKHLFHRVGEYSIHSHLKMEGSWQLYPRWADADAHWDRPAHLARAVLRTESLESVGFELGTLDVMLRTEEHTVRERLGPDLLDPAWGQEHTVEAAARLAARPEVPVFVAVLDQANLAGIGNVYATELCFLRGVLPTRPMGDTDAAAIVDLARRLLVANRDRTTRTTTGDLRRGQTTWVYRRVGQSCRRCGTTIHGGRLGPEVSPAHAEQDRSVTWCPHCQR